MSLLDSGNQTVTVFLEESFTDPDGNKLTRPSKSGVRARAQIQPVNSMEDNAQGFDTTGIYTLRFPRSFRHTLGSQAQLDWRGERWVVHGEVARYTNSAATSHNTYLIKRH